MRFVGMCGAAHTMRRCDTSTSVREKAYVRSRTVQATQCLSNERITFRANAMNGVKIYESSSGWIYEVWFMGRAVVIGCCLTLEDATREAALA
jgi:hypothetical protein